MKTYFKTYLFIAALAVLSFLSCKPRQGFDLQAGDLIFQESAVSRFENSIGDVTKSIDGYSFTHVGIVYIDENKDIYVLEATPPKVKMTPIKEYLVPETGSGDKPVSVVGRLKEEYRRYIPGALSVGLTLQGLDYDHAFRLNDDKYYCSEFIYEIFMRASDGKEIFRLNDMTFKSTGTGEISGDWKNYFEELGMPVPEGEPGINPGAMSRSDVLDIVHYY